MNKSSRSNSDKSNGFIFRKKISRDKRLLIKQSLSSSDYLSLPDNENDSFSTPIISNQNQRKSRPKKSGGAYDWKTYDAAMSENMSTCSSVMVSEKKQHKKRSCFDSLMNKKVDDDMNICCWDETIKEKMKKYNCALPAKKIDTFCIQRHLGKDGTPSEPKPKEDNTHNEENPNSDFTSLSTSECSSTYQDLVGFLPSPTFKEPNNELLENMNDLTDSRCLQPNKCHVNTSYYMQKNVRLYMEDKMTIQLLGSKILDKPTPKTQNLSRKHFSDTKLDNYYDISPRSTTDFDADCYALKTLERDLQVRESLSIFAVFDGHGGDQASQYCSDEVSSNLCEQETFLQDINSALKSTFQKMDEDFISSGQTDGTTACVCVLAGNERVICANVGDSRAIVIRSDGIVIPLSRDHKPGDPREVKRINDLGGSVTYRDRWRVQGTLAVSRGIGDAALKPYITSEPDIFEHEIDKNDLFLVIASDGIWDVLSNNDVADIVTKHSCISSNGTPKTFAPNFKWAARQLCKQAIKLHSKDNLSAIVVDLTTKSYEI